MSIRAEDMHPLFTYRSFASVVPLVAMVVAVIVIATGVAAVAFLFAEGRLVPAMIAVVLSGAFSVLIAMLVPATSVTLHGTNGPELVIAQESNVSFPVVVYVAATPDRKVRARFRRSVFSRLFRNRWTILAPDDDRKIGDAFEESLSRAFVRKFAGKFNPRYESNMIVRYREQDAAWIVRRPDANGASDYLDITGTIDRYVAVALATLILGSEP